MKKISLVMIVRDEESRLRQCINSIKDVVDEYVICDTGSMDKTVELVRELTGADAIRIPFDNYVDTKNKALSFATGDYVLFMDADESIILGADRIRGHAEAGVECVVSPIVEGEITVLQTYYRARLWKNKPENRFSGPGVHEVMRIIPGSIKDSEIIVKHSHVGKDAGHYKSKFVKYRKILEDYLKDNPGDHRATYYLGRTLLDLDFPLMAVEQFEKYLSFNGSFRDERWDAAYKIAVCYKMLGEYDLAHDACNRAINIDPRRAEAWYFKGSMYFQEQNFELAAQHYERAIQLPLPNDVVLFLEPEKYNRLPKETLAVCYDRLHRYRDVARIYDKLYDGRQTDTRILNNLNWIHSQTKKKIFFCLGNTPETVYGGMIDEIGVGGVETTYIELPTELSKIGHDVFVFARCETEHIYNGVSFIPFQKIHDYTDIAPNVVITSRWFDSMYYNGVGNAKKIIWLQDSHFADPNRADAWQVSDAVVVSSRWHSQYVAERIGHSIGSGKTHVIPLSIRKELYQTPIEKNPLQVIYSSNPDRGLYILMDMWDEICNSVPGIHLVVTYGWEGLKTWGQSQEWQDKINSDRQKVESWANSSGNILITGRLKKSELAKRQMESTLCLYPNNFRETFCITGLETQMAKTPMITTMMGALKTTLDPRYNILLSNDPFSSDYKSNFIRSTTEMFSDKDRLNTYALGCFEFAQAHPSWSDVALQWEQLIFNL